MSLRLFPNIVKVDPQSVYFIPIIIFFLSVDPTDFISYFWRYEVQSFRRDFRGNGELLEAVDLIKVAIDDSC